MLSVSKLVVAGLLTAALSTGCAGQATPNGDPSVSQASTTPGQDLGYHPTTSNLLDLEKLKFYQGGAFDVPARKGGCPAARISWPSPKRDDIVDGVDYSSYGESIYGLGDFNADGHSEVVIVVMCSAPGRSFGETLVVIGATGPSSYKTIAAGVVGPKVRGIVVQGTTIIGYNGDWKLVQGDEVARYRITRGDQVTRIST